MTVHICFSQKIKHLIRWREAFPDGHIAESPDGAPATDPSALLWLHLASPNESNIKQLLRAAREILPENRIVVISNTPSQQEALEALNYGAAGYCHAQATPRMLRQVATVVSNGGLWVGNELINRLLAATEKIRSANPDHLAFTRLTPREREVALAVSRGISNKEVARELAISERTVKAHLGAIFEKLGVRDRLQLALLLSRDNLPDNDNHEPSYGPYAS